MRDIKFRQPIFYSKDHSFYGWHYWGFVNEGVFVSPLTPVNDINGKSEQFTGLEDRKANNIYDNDIVKVIGYGYGQIQWHQTNCKFKIYFPQMKAIELKYGLEMEVIGNIHENPELLKEIK